MVLLALLRIYQRRACQCVSLCLQPAAAAAAATAAATTAAAATAAAATAAAAYHTVYVYMFVVVVK